MVRLKLGIILGSVRKKHRVLCKCLRFSKSGFATFSNSDFSQKGPALSASDQQIMIVTAIIYVEIIDNFYLIVNGRRMLDV